MCSVRNENRASLGDIREAEVDEMAGTYGKIFSLAKENEPVPGCTVSGGLMPGVTVFSLGKGTDISAERYPAESIHLNFYFPAT